MSYSPNPYMWPFADVVDDPINDNFAGAAIDTAGTRRSGATAWTSANIGASTVTMANRRLAIQSPVSASLQIRGYYQAVPTGNWCLRVPLCIRTAGAVTECSVGMFLRDSTGGKIETWAISWSVGNAQVWAGKYTNSTTYSGTRVAAAFASLPSFLEIEYDGTNYYLRHGHTSFGMWQLTTAYAFAKTNFLAAAADGIGVFSENDTSILTTGIFGGFYRVPTSIAF